MRIRAMVRVDEKRQHHWSPNQVTVVMSPVHAGAKVPEAEQFSEATPSGRIELLMKKSVADAFTMGGIFDVLFTPVAETQS